MVMIIPHSIANTSFLCSVQKRANSAQSGLGFWARLDGACLIPVRLPQLSLWTSSTLLSSFVTPTHIEAWKFCTNLQNWRYYDALEVMYVSDCNDYTDVTLVSDDTH